MIAVMAFDLCFEQSEASHSELLRARVHPLRAENAAYIVDDIGKANPHCGQGDANGSDNQPSL